MKNARSRRTLLLVSLLAAVGCSQPEPTDAVAQSLSSDGGVTGTGGGCQLPTAASSTCAGPWKYHKFADSCSFTSDAAHCGSTPVVANSCNYSESTTTQTGSSNFQTCVPGCTKWSPACNKAGAVSDACTCLVQSSCASKTCSQSDAITASDCATLAKNAINAIVIQTKGVPGVNTAKITYQITKASACSCAYQITGVPVVKYGQNLLCGTSGNVPKSCTLYGSACGATGETVQYTPGGKQLAALPLVDGSYTSSCLTGDDLVAADATSADQKASRLLETYREPGVVQDAAALSGVTATNDVTAKVLLETKADLLTAERRAQLEALYVADPQHTPSCGIPWTPHAPPAACAQALASAADTLDASSGFSDVSAWQLNGSASKDGTHLRLTSGAALVGSAFTKQLYSIRQFAADFTFQQSNVSEEGLTFTLQAATPTSLGNAGAGLGFQTIGNSLAVKLDLKPDAGESTSSTGIYANGQLPSGGSTSLDGVDLRSTHVMHATVGYDGATLTVAVQDQTTGVTSTHAYAVDLPGVLRSPNAYVGFTAANGTSSGAQAILGFKFTQRVPRAWAQLDDEMAVCIRIADSPAQVRALYEDRCLTQLGQKIEALPAACDKSTFSQYEDLAVKWLKARVGTSTFDWGDDTQRSQNLAKVERELALIGDWFGNEQAIRGGDDDALAADLNQVLAAFWNGVNPGFGALNLADGASVSATQLDDAAKAELEANRTVLLGLFAAGPDGGPRVGAEPMLYLLGDALESVWERLDDAVLYHDLGCRFAGCKQRGVTDELTDMWQLLGAVDDLGRLGEVTARFGSNQSHLTQDWRDVANVMQSGHALFERAVLAVLGLPANTAYGAALLESPAGTLPAPLAHVRRIVLDGVLKTRNFQNSGALDGARNDVLQTGLDKDLSASTSGFNELSDLESSLDQYAANRTALVNALAAQVNNAGQQTSLIDKINQLLHDWNDADAQIAALRHNTEVDDAKFGDFMAAWKARATSTVLGNQYQSQAWHPFRVAPQGRSTSETWADRSVLVDTQVTDVPVDASQGTVAGRPLAIPLQRGEILQLGTQGTWAPTCALTTYAWPTPPFDAENLPKVDTASLVGPEGYVLTSSSAGYTATGKSQAHSDDTYLSGELSIKECLELVISYGFKLGPLGATVESVTSICGAFATGRKTDDTASHSTSSGSDERTAASFVSGLRVPAAPLPDFPVGSLVVVGQPTDGGQPVVFQAVQSGSSAFIANTDLTAYLVVNDTACGPPDAAQGGLDVTVTKLTPAGEVAKVVGPLMAAEIDQLRHGKIVGGVKTRLGLEDYVAQGVFLSSDRQSLTSSALDDLRNQLATIVDAQGNQLYTLETIPADLLDLYTARIDYELDRIDRAVQIQVLSLKQRSVEDNLHELGDELSNEQSAQRLYALEARWALHDVDGYDLRRNSVAVAQFLSEVVYPYLTVRYNRLIDPANSRNDGVFVNGAPIAPIADLLNVDWRNELYDDAYLIDQAGRALKTILTNAIQNATPVNLKSAVISFPRPSQYAACVEGNGLCNLTAYNYDLATATQLWDQIDATGEGDFQITPEDLYALHDGNSVLGCHMSAPVVKSMQVFFNTGDLGGTYGSGYTAPISSGGDLLFPTESGPLPMVMADQDWLAGDASILFGTSTEVGSQVDALLTSPQVKGSFANGLSPFGSFHIDLLGYQDPGPFPGQARPITANMAEMVVVFQVEYRQSASPLDYIGTCR